MRQELLRQAMSLLSGRFVAPSCTLTIRGQERKLHTEKDITRAVTAFLDSDSRFLLLTGEFGMGKTYLAKYLASQVANEATRPCHRVPVFVDSLRLTSDAVLSEVTSQVIEAANTGMEERDLRRHLRDRRVLIIFDSLDQLPYKVGEVNRIDAIVDFAEREGEAGGARGKIVLVVRDEFVRFTSRFDHLIGDPSVRHLRVEGFPDLLKMKAYLEDSDPNEGPRRWERLCKLIAQDSKIESLFARPVTLERFSNISPGKMQSMSSTGTTLAEVFRLSLGDLTAEARMILESLALRMFQHDKYFINLRSAQLVSGLPSEGETVAVATQTGLVEIDRHLCYFRHASFRDFFVATRYLDAIEEDTIQILSSRKNSYLVSEFLAGLLDQRSLIALISQAAVADSTTIKINAMDTLCELERRDLKDAARGYFDKEIARVRRTEMNEYKVGLLTNAGIFGYASEIDQVISYASKIGIDTFLKHCFFPTADDFTYYDHSQERCTLEWINICRQKKYGETRRLIAFLLGETGATAAIPMLDEIAESLEAPLALRDVAATAAREIRSS